jgi:hypothetical protein
MPEWRKIFEAEDSDFAGVMEVCSSIEMGASGASHLGTGDTDPKPTETDHDQVPVNTLVFNNSIHLDVKSAFR